MNRLLETHLKANTFWLVYAAGLTLFSFGLFFQWGLMVGALFSIFFAFRLLRLEATLLPSERRCYWLAIVLYPPAETAVLMAKMHNHIQLDFDWINRLEHFCWAIALSLFFLPFLAGIWKRLNSWQNLVFIVGFVCLLGNLNEFLEYLLRIQTPAINQSLFAYFYSDSIFDMTMNLCGGLMSFVLLKAILTKPRQWISGIK
jgi:hypothetical protein